MCAPTGAGKTNVAMMTILQAIEGHRIGGVPEVRAVQAQKRVGRREGVYFILNLKEVVHESESAPISNL